MILEHRKKVVALIRQQNRLIRDGKEKENIKKMEKSKQIKRWEKFMNSFMDYKKKVKDSENIVSKANTFDRQQEDWVNTEELNFIEDVAEEALNLNEKANFFRLMNIFNVDLPQAYNILDSCKAKNLNPIAYFEAILMTSYDNHLKKHYKKYKNNEFTNKTIIIENQNIF